jgi:hypothetical protein
VKAANLTPRFLLELAALAALAYWGWSVTWVLALAAPAAWIVLWATFGPPKAKVTLSTLWRIVFEAIVFGAAADALWAAGQEVLASRARRRLGSKPGAARRLGRLARQSRRCLSRIDSPPWP